MRIARDVRRAVRKPAVMAALVSRSSRHGPGPLDGTVGDVEDGDFPTRGLDGPPVLPTNTPPYGNSEVGCRT